jgi:hypothetical protein
VGSGRRSFTGSKGKRRAAFAPGTPWGRAFSFDGKGYFRPAVTLRHSIIDDRFTLSAWDLFRIPRPTAASSPACRTRPGGRGYGVLLNNGKVHVHLTSNYDDDAIRIETEETLLPKRWYHIAVTYHGLENGGGSTGFTSMARRRKEKVLLDTLYRPFRNAGRTFPGTLARGRRRWSPQALSRD